jgi:hypothetical protein
MDSENMASSFSAAVYDSGCTDVFQDVFPSRDAQEAGALLEGLRPELRNLL